MNRTLTSLFSRPRILAMLFPMLCWSLHSEVLDIGSRLELFVEPSLVEELRGEARLQLQRPIPQGVALVTDRPWEGNACFTFTIFQDENRYRMYYRGWHFVTGKKLEFPRRQVTCYAESLDGIHWYRPQLGLVEFEGSKRNNILLDRLPNGDTIRNFVPFKDANPAASPDARYKAFSLSRKWGLYAWKSADAIHWELMADRPVITKGYFDSQNLAFWDSPRNEYREYHRDFRQTAENQPRTKGIRDVMTGTSQDFLNWTDPVWLNYPGSPDEHLYTNQIIPYHRAPHILLGFPNRYLERGWSDSMRALPGLEHRRLRAGVSLRYGTGLTDGLLMASRDRIHFHRWREAFIRPGLRPVDNWVYGDNNQNWGLVETRSHIEGAPNEISIYATEGVLDRRESQPAALHPEVGRVRDGLGTHVGRGDHHSPHSLPGGPAAAELLHFGGGEPSRGDPGRRGKSLGRLQPGGLPAHVRGRAGAGGPLDRGSGRRRAGRTRCASSLRPEGRGPVRLSVRIPVRSSG